MDPRAATVNGLVVVIPTQNLKVRARKVDALTTEICHAATMVIVNKKSLHTAVGVPPQAHSAVGT